MESISNTVLKKELDEKICKYLKNKAFSACSVGYLQIIKNKSESNSLCYGYTGKDKTGKIVSLNTYFDLASLTKPLVTSLSIMVLVEKGTISLDDRLSKFYTRDLAEKGDISLYNLLTHSSGLPAHKKYYKELILFPEDQRNSKIIDWILDEKIYCTPGASSLYSDLGFILLGDIVKRISGLTLDIFWQKHISIPLKLENELFFNVKEKKGSGVYSTTGLCEWTNKELSGRVHDDNCRALGGVAGHAGLFGTVSGVLRLCEMIMTQFSGGLDSFFKSSENLDMFLKKKKGSSWALGFDTPSGPQSSSGSCFSEKSIGHLGFTGTSFWMDLNKGVCIVLLTNRVIYGEDLDFIRSARPIIHDIIMDNLIKK